MTNTPFRIDLHLHTSCSDGSLSPVQTVAEALRLGLAMIAITDHDTISGVRPAQEAARNTPLIVVSGIELNSDYKGSEVHVLGYGVDLDSPALDRARGTMTAGRHERNLAILERLRELEMPLDLEQVKEIAQGEVIARPHIARAMVNAGYVSSTQEAFDRYLAKNGPAFFERISLTPPEACRAVLESGGIPVLAHPAKVTYRELLPDLLAAGIVGMEAYHPDHTSFQRRQVLEVAQKHNLLITGGSDSHGSESNRDRGIGSIRIPDHVGHTFRKTLLARGIL